MDLIQPKILKGFRDFLPQDEIILRNSASLDSEQSL